MFQNRIATMANFDSIIVTAHHILNHVESLIHHDWLVQITFIVMWFSGKFSLIVMTVYGIKSPD